MHHQVLITGGCGFIGSAIARACVARGLRVRVLDNLATGSLENVAEIRDAIEWIEADVRDPERCRSACHGVDAIFHQAALPSVVRSIEDPAATHEVNVTGTLNLLLAARDADVNRFVFASSSSVYGDSAVLPKREDHRPQPRSPYAFSKWAGEGYARLFHQLYDLPAICLRYFNVFGPRQDPESPYAAVIPLFIRAAHRGQPLEIHGDGGQTRDFTYVDDVVAANLACLDAPLAANGNVYNVAAGRRNSILDLARFVCERVGCPLVPRHMAARAGDVRDSQADAEAARRDLGWVASVSLAEGLRHTVDWFLQREPRR